MKYFSVFGRVVPDWPMLVFSPGGATGENPPPSSTGDAEGWFVAAALLLAAVVAVAVVALAVLLVSRAGRPKPKDRNREK